MTNHEHTLSDLRFVAGVDQQAGALAWMEHQLETKIWIVTSRRTRRWVLPKGGIDPGMTASEAAAQEAFEEAGLIGDMSHTDIGGYRIPKIRPPLIWTLEVAVYPMRVETVLDDWLESDQRTRKLVTLDEASELIVEPEIVLFLRRKVPRLASDRSHSRR